MQINAVGLDISKLTIDAAIKQNDAYTVAKFDNTKQGHQALRQWLKAHKAKKPHICMEATGIYYEAIADYLSDYYTLSVVNPLKIKKYSEAVFARTKNDKQDAKLIADFCATVKPQPWIKPTQAQRQLDRLIACQSQLIGQCTALQNRQHVATDDFIKEVNQTIIDTLKAQIARLKAEIKAHINSNQDMKQKLDKIQTIDGIGEGSAPSIINYLHSKEFTSVKQYIAYIGLCPSEKQSGTSVKGKGRLTKYGHRQAKSVYFMPALVAYRNRMYPDFIKRLEAKGKPKKVIIVALMRKLATIAYYVYTTNTEFDRARYRKTEA